MSPKGVRPMATDTPQIKVKREAGFYGLWRNGVRVGMVERNSLTGWWWATWSGPADCSGRCAYKARAIERAMQALRGDT